MAEKADLSLDDIIKMKKKGPRPQIKRGPANNNNKQQISRRSGGTKLQTRLRTQPAKQESTRLHVSNLHFNVSNEDVRELFGELGNIKKAAVHYDKSGRSLGTAEVIYSKRDDAIRAIKKYNNLPLDGRPMSITLVPSFTPTARSPTKSRIGIKKDSGVSKRPPTKGPRKGPINKNRSGKPQRGGPRNQRQSVTAEQLDADLESYRMDK